MDATPPDIVPEMRGITKGVPGVKALDGMNLEVRAGADHIPLVGNGAGESTLITNLSGACAIDGGEIIFKGETLGGRDTGAELERGISMTLQEFAPILDTTIAGDTFPGREPPRGTGVRGHLVDFDRMFADTKALMDRLGPPHGPRTTMRDLSIAAAQSIGISKAVSRDAPLVTMDEPTSVNGLEGLETWIALLTGAMPVARSDFELPAI